MLPPLLAVLAAALTFTTPTYSFTPPAGWSQVDNRPIFRRGKALIGVAPIALAGAENVARVYLTNPELKALGHRKGLLGGRPAEEFEVVKDLKRYNACSAVDQGAECLLFFLEYADGPEPPAELLATYQAAKASFRFKSASPGP